MTQEPVRSRAYFQQQQRRRSSARCLVQKVQDIFSKHLICKTCTCRGNGRPVKPRYWLLQPSLLNWRCRPCNKRCVLSSRVEGGLNVGKDASCASRGLSAFLHPTCSQFNLCFPHLVDGGGLLIDKVSERRKGFFLLSCSLCAPVRNQNGWASQDNHCSTACHPHGRFPYAGYLLFLQRAACVTSRPSFSRLDSLPCPPFPLQSPRVRVRERGGMPK